MKSDSRPYPDVAFDDLVDRFGDDLLSQAFPGSECDWLDGKDFGMADWELLELPSASILRFFDSDSRGRRILPTLESASPAVRLGFLRSLYDFSGYMVRWESTDPILGTSLPEQEDALAVQRMLISLGSGAG